jgi:ribosomal protein L16/L10AE
MGKGKGKPSNWAVKIPKYCIFIELRNVRIGRGFHFLRKVTLKLPGQYKVISRYETNLTLVAFGKDTLRYDFFF